MCVFWLDKLFSNKTQQASTWNNIYGPDRNYSAHLAERVFEWRAFSKSIRNTRLTVVQILLFMFFYAQSFFYRLFLLFLNMFLLWILTFNERRLIGPSECLLRPGNVPRRNPDVWTRSVCHLNITIAYDTCHQWINKHTHTYCSDNNSF